MSGGGGSTSQPPLKAGLGDPRPLAFRGHRKGPSWGRENSGKARTKPAARQLEGSGQPAGTGQALGRQAPLREGLCVGTD